tara:strand:- start:301 stop:531 length:231 start_codon:yes stop_codon:yes gene_type:complete
MRTKAIDYCSCCECDILWIDEEEGWVNYVPTGAFDKFGNEIMKTLCSDCSATEFSDLRETSQKINEWLYDQISLIS